MRAPGSPNTGCSKQRECRGGVLALRVTADLFLRSARLSIGAFIYWIGIGRKSQDSEKAGKTVIFGTGFMGRVHTEGVRRLGNVEVAGIATLSERR